MAVVTLAAVGTRPAAEAVRERAGLQSSADLVCYVDALAAAFDDAPDCS